MNLRLIFGIGLFLIGILAAVMGITDAMTPAGARPTVFGTQDGVLERAIGNFAIPVIAGLSLALGGLLLGLSLGHWEHPRTHLEPGDQVVNPEGHHKMTHV
jgi:hypothetical protein